MHPPRKPKVRLGSIRGFEAAARHLSFTEAAAELTLTQGAISRQVTAIERDLGTPLFKRMTRKIALTEAGQQFYEAVAAALATLDRCSTELASRPQSQMLTVSILPTLGTVWLMPRLHRFTLANPDIDVRVITSIDPADFRQRGIDIAIRVGSRPGQTYDAFAPRIDLEMSAAWNDVEAIELFPDILVPVMARSLRRSHSSDSVRDLLSSLPLIHTSSRRYAWSDWLRVQGLPDRTAEEGPEFGHFFMSLEEARTGRGIALVPSVVLPNLEYRRSLWILPMPEVLSAGEYYVLTKRDHRSTDAVVRFLTWIEAEAEAHRKRMRLMSRSRRAPLIMGALD